MPTLEFKGKQIVYAHHLTVPSRTLEIDAKKSFAPKGGKSDLDDNLIIHGDNLHALKALMPRYAGRVNCIYIDPPYNTGNEKWVYNDNVNSPMMKEWLKDKNPVDGEDLERHDKWLCMMWPRLHLLRELLAEDGVIFVSIDDNEQHRLRMVMDEIFGEGNFVACIIWRKKAGGGQDSEYLAREHEYVLAYRKADKFKMKFRNIEIDEKEYKKIKNGKKCKFLKLEKWGSGSYRADRPTMFYSIKDPDGKNFYPKAPDGKEGRWRTRPLVLDKNHIHWEKRNGLWTPYEVQYYDEVAGTAKIIKDRTIFFDLATTADATNEQKSIFGRKVLDNSKPTGLISRLVTLSGDKKTLILDCCAGTGTTAHAVLKLNKEDNGNRKFILVECEDYANKITAERIRRVIKGVPKSKDENLKKGLGGSFTYCTLGDEISVEKMLTGKKLPNYETLARYVAYTATGQSPDKIRKARGKDGFFYETKDRLFYLIYEPNLAFLRNTESALNSDRAERIATQVKAKKKTAVVFATHKFMGQRELTEMGIVFAQLPYSINS